MGILWGSIPLSFDQMLASDNLRWLSLGLSLSLGIYLNSCLGQTHAWWWPSSSMGVNGQVAFVGAVLVEAAIGCTWRGCRGCVGWGCRVWECCWGGMDGWVGFGAVLAGLHLDIAQWLGMQYICCTCCCDDSLVSYQLLHLTWHTIRLLLNSGLTGHLPEGRWTWGLYSCCWPPGATQWCHWMAVASAVSLSPTF